MKRFPVSGILFALPLAALAIGAEVVSSANAAGQQAEQPAENASLPVTSAPTAQAPAAQASTLQAQDGLADTAEEATQPALDTPMPALRQVECMAKVIVHEAGNQVRRGQIAVAQVIRNRMHKFGDDACGVVKQRGQFFNVDSYQPRRDSVIWRDAVEIATATLKGKGDDVVPGALFFHTAGHPMRGRLRLAQIDDHVFYR